MVKTHRRGQFPKLPRMEQGAGGESCLHPPRKKFGWTLRNVQVDFNRTKSPAEEKLEYFLPKERVPTAKRKYTKFNTERNMSTPKIENPYLPPEQQPIQECWNCGHSAGLTLKDGGVDFASVSCPFQGYSKVSARHSCACWCRIIKRRNRRHSDEEED